MYSDDGEHLEYHAGDAERLKPRVGPDLRRSRESLLDIPTGRPPLYCSFCYWVQWLDAAEAILFCDIMSRLTLFCSFVYVSQRGTNPNGYICPYTCKTEIYQVKGEHGNSLTLTCYEEEMGEKRLIGKGSTKVVETGADGIWVPITDTRWVRALILYSNSYRIPRICLYAFVQK